MSDEIQDDPDAPVWGAEGWPRPLEGGLDEGDRLLILSMLELTPLERLQAIAGFANGVAEIQRGRVRSG